MKAWHGSDRKFDRFSSEFALSGEGVAMRGEGVYVSLDRDVAAFYARRGRIPDGYVYTVTVPDASELLNLDAGISDEVMFILKGAYAFSGVDLDQIFKDASRDDELSMSYPENAAAQQFQMLWTDPYNDLAADELKEWSPGYDWDNAVRLLRRCGMQFNEHSSNHDLLMIAYSHMGAERTHALLIDNEVYGAIGSEPLSEGEPETALSAVIFRSEDVKILKIEQLEDHGPEPEFLR